MSKAWVSQVFLMDSPAVSLPLKPHTRGRSSFFKRPLPFASPELSSEEWRMAAQSIVATQQRSSSE